MRGARGAARRNAFVTDSLVAEAVEPLLSGRFGHPYLHSQTCAASAGLLDGSLPEGSVAVCDEVADGLGPPGSGIFCSVLLQPPPERSALELPLVGCMAAADAVERDLGLAAQIKWPAEVMMNRGSVARAFAAGGAGAVVLSVVVNVNQTREQLAADSRAPAASLLTIDGTRRDRASILATLLGQLELHYDLWRARGIDGIYDFLGPRDFLRGRKVAVNGTTGYATRIDRQGRLEIETESGPRLVESGVVSYER